MSWPSSVVTEDVVDVRSGDDLDWTALRAYLDGALELPAGSLSARQFSGGRANLTYLVTIGPWRAVLRRPPRGDLAPGSHDMAREHRVLSKLAPVYDRAPHALHFCGDESVIGAPFVLLELREGIVVRDEVPEAMAGHDDVRRRIDIALLDAMADLHVVDVEGAGLDDLGRAEGFGARQVQGWRDRWRRVAADGDVPSMDELADRLAATMPEPQRVSVVHNDLKLDNCQFQPDDPDRVTSVFDWDMATVGDPLFDLGSLLVSMQSSPLWVLPVDDALARYAQRSGLRPEAFGWYLAFATWRTAVVLQQLAHRYHTGDTTDDRLASYADHVPAYAERAAGLLP